MPAIIAHHLFGAEAYSALQPIIGADDNARDAFLLGNIGPDPLFCLGVLPRCVSFRHVGSVMHAERPAEMLDALHRRCTVGGNDATRAYALGFLCHYLLDSAAHPLVYAQQSAVCNQLDAEPDAPSGSTVHAMVETEIDEWLLREKRGLTVAEFSPRRETLSCASDALVEISAAVADIANAAYGIALPRGAFAASVRLDRAAQLMIDSKRAGLRRYVDYAVLTGRRYPHVLALTHSAGEGDTPFTNEDHVPWPHPFEDGEVICASFEELYAMALDRACTLLPEFTREDFSPADCAELTGGLNFRGERIE